ncbi:MAG: nucleotide excision repair endonuclease, partial [Sarcina sp.]
MAYVYRFIDQHNKIIYVGKTIDINRRMNEHFGGKGHLSSECYNNTQRIEYQTFKTEADALIMEQYYISKFNPRFNKMGKSRDLPSIKFDEKAWRVYKTFKVKTYTNTDNSWGYKLLLKCSTGIVA